MSTAGDGSSSDSQALKSRYFKYLEALCDANGVEIETLKGSAPDQELLEMFFGGLPVLVGLRYFSALRVLRLYGQNLQGVQQLSEVSDTLEELWLCEGSLEDLAGLESCSRLTKLYMYENKATSLDAIANLKRLEVLWVQDNSLQSLAFLQSLDELSTLKVGGSQFNDKLALSVPTWPPKLQNLDISGNTLSGLQPLMGLSCCEVIRNLNLSDDKYPASDLIRGDAQLGWLCRHFPFLELLDGTKVGEKILSTYSTQADKVWLSGANKTGKASKRMVSMVDTIKKNAVRIAEKYKSVISALSKAAGIVTKKEGRRELASQLQDLYQFKARSLNSSRDGCIACEQAAFYLSHYLLPSWHLESANQTDAREPFKQELPFLERLLETFASGDEPKHRLRAAIFFDKFACDLDMLKQCFFIQSGTQNLLWELADVVDLCDRWEAIDPAREFKLFRDLNAICSDSNKTSSFCICPVVKIKPELDLKEYETNNNICETKGQEKSLPWRDLSLVAVCIIELQRSTWTSFDELRNMHQFEEQLNEQIRRLKDLGIELKLEKVLSMELTGPESLDNEEDAEIRTDMAVKVAEVVTNLRPGRVRVDGPFWTGRECSLRDPLELSMAFSSEVPRVLRHTKDLTTRITSMNLRALGIGSLEGIDQFVNLRYLCLADNVIMSVKKMKTLTNLVFLNISNNNISKADDLPPSITSLDISRNSIVSLGFCSKMLLLTKLNAAHNNIKSTKGVEECKSLEFLSLAENHLKDKTDFERLQDLPKLRILELAGNQVLEGADLKKKLVNNARALVAVDQESIPEENRVEVVQRKTGKVLSWDFIQQQCGDLDGKTELDLSGQQFQITSLNLANNQLDHVNEITSLRHLKSLNLSHNNIVSFVNSPHHTGILESLEQLDLSYNELTCQTLARLELKKLLGLRFLNLQGNKLIRFDGTQFDLENLEELNVSRNEIKQFRKKNLKSLKRLDLSGNHIKDLDGLSATHLEELDLKNNKINSCSTMNALKDMRSLRCLDCQGNPVTNRRVYLGFIQKQLPALKTLDSKVVQRTLPETKENTDEVGEDRQLAQPVTQRDAVRVADLQKTAARKFMDVAGKQTEEEPVNADGVIKETSDLHRSASSFIMAPSILKVDRSESLTEIYVAGKRATKHYRNTKFNGLR